MFDGDWGKGWQTWELVDFYLEVSITCSEVSISLIIPSMLNETRRYLVFFWSTRLGL